MMRFHFCYKFVVNIFSIYIDCNFAMKWKVVNQYFHQNHQKHFVNKTNSKKHNATDILSDGTTRKIDENIYFLLNIRKHLHDLTHDQDHCLEWIKIQTKLSYKYIVILHTVRSVTETNPFEWWHGSNTCSTFIQAWNSCWVHFMFAILLTEFTD